MKQRIKTWWDTERVDRFEKGTSQDYCPTNGGAVLYFVFCLSMGAIMVLFFLFVKG